MFTQNVWGLGNEGGHFNVLHAHPNAVLSGVLHLDDGGSTEGATVLLDPRPVVQCSGAAESHRKEAFFLCSWCGANMCPAVAAELPWDHAFLLRENTTSQAEPTPGQLLVWPAWTPHRVLPHTGAGTRMALAFNVWIEQDRRGSGGRAPTLGQHHMADQVQRLQLFHDFVASRRSPLKPEPNAKAKPGSLAASLAPDGFTTTLHWPTPLAEFTVGMQSRNTRHPLQHGHVHGHTCPERELGLGAATCGAWDGNGGNGGPGTVGRPSPSPSLKHAILRAVAVYLKGRGVVPAAPDAMGIHAKVLTAQDLPAGPHPFPDAAAPGVQPQLAGVLAVATNTKGAAVDVAAHVASVEVPDPRPDARSNIKIRGSGNVLRWLGQPAQGLVFPAWLASSVRLRIIPPPPRSSKPTKRVNVSIVCFWVDACV